MLRYIMAIFLLLCITGCVSPRGMRNRRAGNRYDGAEVSRVIITYSEKLKHEQHLHLEDSRIYYDRGINRIQLIYSSMDSLDLWDARKVLVDVVEEFIDRINQNVRIYPRLGRTPFDASNLEVEIHYDSFYNEYVDLYYVGLTTLRNGDVVYYAADALACDLDCRHKRTETYAQSKNFVTFKRQGEALYRPKKMDPRETSAFGNERYFGEDEND